MKMERPSLPQDLGLFFFPGEVTGFPDGLIWLTYGRFVWRFENGGAISLISHTGTFQDVCTLLA
jgi:hypothetical protein